MCVTCKVTPSSSPFGPKMMSLPYRMLLTVILASFDAPLHQVDWDSAVAVNTSSVKLMHLHLHPDINVVALPQPLPSSSSTTTTSQPIPPSVGPFLSQPSSSVPPTSPIFPTDDYFNLNSPSPPPSPTNTLSSWSIFLYTSGSWLCPQSVFPRWWLFTAFISPFLDTPNSSPNKTISSKQIPLPSKISFF